MANERLKIPKTLKVGFQKRTDTYSQKLAYVTYINEKNQIAKEKSWRGWICEKDYPIEEYENVPMEGFVLNKKAGGYASGWNHRNTYCRVYDPRGFEIEISVENLLFILQECTSSKGKGLEGEFVYSWSGKDIVLLPVDCEDYRSSMDLINKKEKLTVKSLIVGASYKGKDGDNLVYIGRFDYGVDKKEYDRYNRWDVQHYDELFGKKVAFYDMVNDDIRLYSGLGKIDYLVNDSAMSLDAVEDIKERIKNSTLFRHFKGVKRFWYKPSTRQKDFCPLTPKRFNSLSELKYVSTNNYSWYRNHYIYRVNETSLICGELSAIKKYNGMDVQKFIMKLTDNTDMREILDRYYMGYNVNAHLNASRLKYAVVGGRDIYEEFEILKKRLDEFKKDSEWIITGLKVTSEFYWRDNRVWQKYSSDDVIPIDKIDPTKLYGEVYGLDRGDLVLEFEDGVLAQYGQLLSFDKNNKEELM